MRTGLFTTLLLAVVACKDATGKQTPPAPTPAPAPAKPAVEEKKGPQPIETTRDKMEADRADRAAEAAEKDGTKGDKADSEWVPAEFKQGMSKWKDVGVYVDGKPMGFLTFGELPIALKPTWVKDKVSAEKRPGTDDPGWRWAQQRFYRFDQYLAAIGVDVKRIKELHVYGPKFSETNISTSKDLLGPKGKEFMFRFGANTYGKPIAFVPPGFGNKKSADKIAGVMVYIKKKPPVIVPNEGLALDGELQTGVPYYGDPIRGGIRVYLDDKLVGIIKRQELDAKQATLDKDGGLRWKLVDVLAAQGIDLKKVVEMWAVRDDLRQEHWAMADVASMTFGANSQAKGGLLLTDKNIRANVLAFHTRALKPDEIPAVTPDDQ